MREVFCYGSIFVATMFAPLFITIPVVVVMFAILPRCRRLDGKWDFWQ